MRRRIRVQILGIKLFDLKIDDYEQEGDSKPDLDSYVEKSDNESTEEHQDTVIPVSKQKLGFQPNR